MVLGFGIGLAWNIINKGDNWKYGVGFLLAHQKTRGYVWVGAKWTARTLGPPALVFIQDIAFVTRGAAGLAAETRTAAAIGRGVMIGAAVGVGYTGGAVAGTAIVSQAEKEGIVYEGATADVLDFYLGREEAHYWDQGDKPTPGYFNVPGNVGFIASHYWNKWTKN